MKVIITLHEKDLVYTGVTLVRTKGNHVIILLKDDYTVNDESFSNTYNVSFVPSIRHFVGYSDVVIVDN